MKVFEKIKVCVVGNDYKQQFPLLDYGGIESCVENICFGLEKYFKNKINFSVIVPKIIKNKKKYNFEIIETDEIETSISKKSYDCYMSEVKKIISENIKPDIIWSQSAHSALMLCDLNIPIICTMHDSAVWEGWNSNKYIFRSNVYYRFVSEFLYKNTFNLTEENQKNIKKNSFFIHSGLSEENYVFYPEKKNYVLWVAGLHWGEENKGLRDFIELSKINKNLDFVCFGDGNKNISSTLEELSKNQKNFYYLGRLSRGDDHNKFFGEAKFFMMLSKIPEAFGRTGLESISKGTPVIGYDSGSIREQICYPNVGNVFKISDYENISLEFDKKYDYEKCYEFSKKYHVKNEIEQMIKKSIDILNSQ